MTDAAGIARWIQDLAGSDARLRTESGMRLYPAGVSLCPPLLTRWVSDPEFRELTLPSKPAGGTHAHFGPSAIVVGIAVQPETFQKIRTANNSPRLAHVPADVDRATEILRTRFALAPLYPATRPGADGTRVNFFLATAPDAKKVLIELVEAAR